MNKPAIRLLCVLLFVVAAAACQPGSSSVLLANREPAPDFTVTTTGGSQFTLSQQRGKVVVLFFTSVNCVVCKTQLPEMARFYADYRSKPLEMVAVNVLPEYSQQEFLAYMAKNRGGDHLYVADQGPAVARSYGIQSTGITVIIDPEGRIAGKVFPPGLGYNQLKAAVDLLLP